MAIKQVFGNYFISEIIYDFCDLGRDQHQRWMDQNREAILIDDSFEVLLPEFYQVHYENWMRHDETPHLVEYLQETYGEEQLRRFSLSMKWCRCCSRHSHYKTVPFKPDDALPESNLGCQCSCPCRHMYRLFKRTGLA